jgi:hypothetical protein
LGGGDDGTRPIDAHLRRPGGPRRGQVQQINIPRDLPFRMPRRPHPPLRRQPQQRPEQRHRPLQERPLALRQRPVVPPRRLHHPRRRPPLLRSRRIFSPANPPEGQEDHPPRQPCPLAGTAASRMAPQAQVSGRIGDRGARFKVQQNRVRCAPHPAAPHLTKNPPAHCSD